MEKKICTRIPPPAGDRNARPVWVGVRLRPVFAKRKNIGTHFESERDPNCWIAVPSKLKF